MVLCGVVCVGGVYSRIGGAFFHPVEPPGSHLRGWTYLYQGWNVRFSSILVFGLEYVLHTVDSKDRRESVWLDELHIC